MKGGHSQRRRFSLQALCVVHSPTSEEEQAAGRPNLQNEKGVASRTGSSDPAEVRITPGTSNRQSRRRRPPQLQPAATLATSTGTNLSPPPGPVKSHYKVVVMGSARTGKTSLVSQFLYSAYTPRYRPTVEDMHTVELDCQGLDLRLDILDTGGSYVFPAMRTLAIKSADGFILVCAADDPASLEEVEHCRAQILEDKGSSFPCVVVLNKRDLIRSGSESSESSPNPYSASNLTDDEQGANSGSRRSSSSGRRASGTIEEDSIAVNNSSTEFLCPEMVESLVTCDWGHGFVPASAKTNYNVVQVFQELFVQAKSRIALSPAVRKRRQSLPARTLLTGSNNGSPQHHHFSLHGNHTAAAAAAATAAAAAAAAASAVTGGSASTSSSSTSSVKRNSCTIS